MCVIERAVIGKPIKVSEIKRRRKEPTDLNPEAQEDRQPGTPKIVNLITGVTRTVVREEGTKERPGGRMTQMRKSSSNSRSSKAQTRRKTGIGTTRPKTERTATTNTLKEIGRSTTKEKKRMPERRTETAAMPKIDIETKRGTAAAAMPNARRGTKNLGEERRRGEKKAQMYETGIEKDHQAREETEVNQAQINDRLTITHSKMRLTRAK